MSSLIPLWSQILPRSRQNATLALAILVLTSGGPGVGLALCCFVVYSARRFVVCLSMCHFFLVFFGPFGVAVALLGEGRGEGGAVG